MTATLLPFAASSLIALSAGTPAGGAAMADETVVEVSVEQGDEANRGSSRARTNDARRDGGSGHVAAEGGERRDGNRGAPPADSRGRSAGHSDAPRHASSHAQPAHSAHHGHATQHRAPPPPPRNTVVVHTRPAPPPPPRAVVVHTRPAPPPRAVVVHDDRGARSDGGRDQPRGLDRTNSFSVGLRTGSYLGGYDNGASYGDFGLGLAARYRPDESLGFELAYGVHSDSWNEESERTTRPLTASAELFAFPRSTVSPYAIGGLTYTSRTIDETLSLDSRTTQSVQTEEALFGPHVGVGIEFAVGEQASLNFEGRATHYLNVSSDDLTSPAALQGTMGLNFYF